MSVASNASVLWFIGSVLLVAFSLFYILHMKIVVAPTVKKVVRHDPIKMQNCADFHSQLTSIMDILAKAAVAEIIKVVENNCCVLRLEINRSQNENERLKRKIQWMESELRGSYCANVYDGLLGTKNGKSHNIIRKFNLHR